MMVEDKGNIIYKLRSQLSELEWDYKQEKKNLAERDDNLNRGYHYATSILQEITDGTITWLKDHQLFDEKSQSLLSREIELYRQMIEEEYQYQRRELESDIEQRKKEFVKQFDDISMKLEENLKLEEKNV